MKEFYFFQAHRKFSSQTTTDGKIQILRELGNSRFRELKTLDLNR